MEKKGINILNLFSGINITELALQQLGITVNKSYQSEICASAIKVCQHHFPDAIQLGDIRNIDGQSMGHIDLLTAGFPCVDLTSLRIERQGLEGEKSGLFFEALRVLKEVNPTYFLFENVGSMSKEDRDTITKLLGVEGIPINSNLVSGQNRNRIYWTNIPRISIPKNKGILLKGIIDDGYVDRDKSNCVLTKNVPHTKKGLIRYLTKSIGQVVFDKDFAALPKKEKLKLVESMDDQAAKSIFRLFAVEELEKLQTLPVGYVSSILKKTPCTRAIGNGFTLEVIKSILANAKF